MTDAEQDEKVARTLQAQEAANGGPRTPFAGLLARAAAANALAREATAKRQAAMDAYAAQIGDYTHPQRVAALAATCWSGYAPMLRVHTKLTDEIAEGIANAIQSCALTMTAQQLQITERDNRLGALRDQNNSLRAQLGLAPV